MALTTRIIAELKKRPGIHGVCRAINKNHIQFSWRDADQIHLRLAHVRQLEGGIRASVWRCCPIEENPDKKTRDFALDSATATIADFILQDAKLK